jgi:hypothetical protein
VDFLATFLAVSSGQDSLERELSPAVARLANSSANTRLAAAQLQASVVAQDLPPTPSVGTPLIVAPLVIGASTDAHVAQMMTAHHVTSDVHPSVIHPPAHIMRRQPAHPPAASTAPVASAVPQTGETRKASIEATLDRLGLKGLNRKRRRVALQTLWAMETPTPDCMERVALACGNISAAAGMEAVKALKIDARTIHFVLKTDEGIELLVGREDVKTIEEKARLNGISLGSPKPLVPSTKKACDALLKSISPAIHSAKHPHGRAYFANWRQHILANMPKHTRAQPDQQSGLQEQTPASLPLPTEAQIQEAAMDSLFDGFGDNILDDGMSSTSLPENPLQEEVGQHMAEPSINEFSSYMVGDPQQCSLSQFCSRNPETNPTIGDSHSMQPEPYRDSNHNRWLTISYINAHGLNHIKLAQLQANLTINHIAFVSETWHIQDPVIRQNPVVMALSPEPYRSPVSRGKGGLALLAHQSISHELRSINIRPHAIWTTIDNMVIAGIYLPPSMDVTEVTNTLNQLPPNTDMIFGDLNARLGSQARPKDADRCDAISLWCSSHGFSLLTPDTQVSNNNIDHILAKPPIKIKDYHIVKACIKTDHPMLTIAVQPCNGSPGERHTARYRISKLNCKEKVDAFIRKVETQACEILAKIKAPRGPWANHDTTSRGDCLDNSLTTMIQTILNSMVGTQKPAGLYTRGSTSRPKARDMATATKTIRSAQRECNARCEIISHNQDLTPQQEAVAHFTAIYKQMHVRPHIAWHSTNHTQPDMVTHQQVAQAIKAYPNSKSPGKDGIDKRVMQRVANAPSFLECLTTLYNMCICTGSTPKRWNVSVIAPIPKTGKDAKYITNRRPVALTVLFRRLFEKIILQKMTPSVKLNRGQAGFRTGFSCSTQVLLAEQARLNGQNIRVFLDLKCAYDSVPIDKMLVKLSDMGVDNYLVKLVQSLFTNCSTTIAVNGILTEEIKLEKGLFQGSLLSPILFDVFIDDMAVSINGSTSHEVPKCLLFADDILLTSSTGEEMCQLLDTVISWCRDNEMTINVPKSGTTHKGTPFPINGDELPQVDSYRYLGIPLSNNGINPTNLIEENIRRATGALNLIKNSLASRVWPPATKTTVYKTFVRSVLEYAAPILILLLARGLYKKTIIDGIKKMQTLQNEAVKWIFCRKRPLPTLESLAGLTSIQHRFEELTARFRLHLEKASPNNPIKYWSDLSRCSGLTTTAISYPIPVDKKVETIESIYKTKSYQMAAKKNRLAGYISPESRLDNGMDACLCIQNHKLRNLAINWRCNTFGFSHKCGACKIPFTRRHTSCTQLNLSHGLRAEYNQEVTLNHSRNLYTILDHLLNKKQYHLFGKCIRKIEARFC